MTTPAGVYPFATQDGKAIPLDIIKPSGIIVKAFTTTDSSFTIPTGYVVGVFFSDKICMVKFGTALPIPLVDGTLYEDSLLVPTDMAVTSFLIEGTVRVRGMSESGTLYLQLVQKWAGLALNKQYNVK